MTIRAKILWILALPFAGFLVLASMKVTTDTAQWSAATEVVQSAQSQSLASALVHQLQLERGMSSGYLSSKGAKFANELRAQRPKTDGALEALSTSGGSAVDGLASFRSKVDGFGVSGGQSFDFYTAAIRTYLDNIAEAAAGSPRPEIVRKATAYYFFLSVKEFTGQLRASLNGVLGVGHFDAGSTNRVDSVLASLDLGQRNFELFSLEEDRTSIASVLADPAVGAAASMVRAVLSAPPEGPFPVDAPTLFAALTAKIDVMKRADDVLSARLRQTAQQSADAAVTALAADGVATLVLMVVALVLAVRLSRSIRHQLGCEPSEVAAVARAIGLGILDVPPAKSRSVGAYQDLRTMVESLRVKAAALEKVADGDLTVDVKGASDQDRLALSLDKMVSSLRDVIGQINNSVEQLTSGAGQVATASQTLAQGATQQASAVEQINASATEVAGQARRNAETAQSASQAALNARTEAAQGKERMEVLLHLVETMSASSAETQRIVKTIDDIAFQVNLLALNANVEAARAGKYGKGFGVVAEEVRSLATRSATAVGETTRMVEGILRNIEAVNTTARLTDASLDGIAASASKVADMLDEIATSSLDQAKALGEVRGGLDQIDSVTQSNTASAEESASAAEELSGQALALRHQVARFQVTR
jgi:methyl-accepting chemotaxis protein